MGDADDDGLRATTYPPAPPVSGLEATAAPAPSQPVSGVEPTVAPAGMEPTLALPIEPSGLEATLAFAAVLPSDHGELVAVSREHYQFGGELARGGMRRILRARDRRLGREVAVKELLDATPDARARFEREARITARLQHPAIVNIYEAGVFAHGEPFYAMKLVAGESLDKVIERTEPAARMSLLPVVLAIADALAYAHSRGVIHRDLKPHNVLVGEFGETVVIDWGLAKDLATVGDDADASAPARPGTDAETVAGAVMGTPAYMPREQAAGEPVDARADVYAIGAIMYKALAGASPYTGASAVQILVQVAAGPPVPLAKLVPELPQDLLTIVDKAMARDRDDRYPSGRELAEDLRRYTTGQLVASHRYTSWQLVRRWARRHRTALTVASLLLAALAITAIVSVRKIVAERDVAEAERVKASAAQAVAETRTTETLAQRAGAEKLADFLLVKLKERLEPIGKLDLLEGIGETVVAYYESVASGGEVGEDQLRQRADALLMLADVDSDKGNLASATRGLETARKIRRDLAAKHPANLEAAFAVAQTEQRLGRVAYMRKDLPATSSHYGAAQQIIKELMAKAPGELKYQRSEALIARLHGDLERERGDLKRALVLVDGARVALEQLAADPKSAGFLFDTYRSLAVIHEARGDAAAQQRAMEQAVELMRRMVKTQPDDVYWVTSLAQATGELGRAMAEHGRPADALALLAEGRAINAALVKLDPDNALVLAAHAIDFSDLGTAYEALARGADALAAFQQSLALRDRLRKQAPDDVAAAYNWTISHERIGRLALQRGDVAGAAEHFEAAGAEIAKLRKASPDVPQFARAASSNEEERGDVALARNDLAGAISHYRGSLAIAADLYRAEPASAERIRDLVGAQLKLAEALRKQPDAGAAQALADVAVERARAAVAQPGSNANDVLVLALASAATARISGDAVALAREAVVVGERDATAHPQDPVRVTNLVEAEAALAAALVEAASRAEAREVIARARARLARLEADKRAPPIARKLREQLQRIAP